MNLAIVLQSSHTDLKAKIEEGSTAVPMAAKGWHLLSETGI